MALYMFIIHMALFAEAFIPLVLISYLVHSYSLWKNLPITMSSMPFAAGNTDVSCNLSLHQENIQYDGSKYVCTLSSEHAIKLFFNLFSEPKRKL